MSTTVSWGGSVDPPAMPACMAGTKVVPVVDARPTSASWQRTPTQPWRARSPRIRIAASLPGPPVTQPPGWVPEPHW